MTAEQNSSTTIGNLEDFLFVEEEIRVIFRADKGLVIPAWPYKRRIGDDGHIDTLRQRINTSYPDLKYEIIDGRGMMQHLRNVRLGKLRESYVANIT